ncbi:hypothetical protein GP486_004166 [Trichoglossum hirsutum]|uniref:Protein kinase domain-containing protein n=1 Tax=Trichoglossum hirsutum TaxID=265104 RepID=A0A9P8RPK6_9PEZI|nr:hypothetical protein GP486_004166 [Trichoglossum hirsutum]
MDGLSIVSLVATIVQFVELGCKITSKAREIYKSADGSLEENIEVEVITKSLAQLNGKLKQPGGASLTEDELLLQQLSTKCQATADELLGVMASLKVEQGKDGKLRSLGKALKSVWKKDEIEDLEKRLAKFREELNLRITVSLREKLDLQALEQSDGFRNLDATTREIAKALLENRDIFTAELQAHTDALLKHQDSQTAILLQHQDSGIAQIIDAIRANTPCQAPTTSLQLQILSTISTMPPASVLSALQNMASILDKRLGASQVSSRALKHKPRDLTLPSALDTANARSTAMFQRHRRVLIEWKSINPELSGYVAAVILQRVDDIARLLRQEGKPAEMRTLSCLGYVVETQNREARYGFIYEMPRGEGPWSLAQLISSSHSAPTVEERVQLAATLAKALLLLHLSFWLHKSIRSANILFFSPTTTPPTTLTEPYLAGFEFSRSDDADPVTEIPGAVAEFNLYRHPECQGLPVEPVGSKDRASAKRPSFCRRFDIYSLGIVMLEIGLWRSAGEVKRDAVGSAGYGADTPDRFREWLLEEGVKEAERATDNIEYAKIVRKCLKGEAFEDDERAVQAFYLNVVRTLDRIAA